MKHLFIILSFPFHKLFISLLYKAEKEEQETKCNKLLHIILWGEYTENVISLSFIFMTVMIEWMEVDSERKGKKKVKDEQNVSERNQGYQKSENQIFEAFFQILDEKCFDKITVSEIIKRAKINRSTFYRHFQDKYAILDRIQQQAIPITNLLLAPYMVEEKSLFDILFSSDYLEKHFPTEYKKAFLQLVEIRTLNFDITEMIHQGFAQSYIPEKSSPNPELERELFADIAVKMLLYKIDDNKRFSEKGLEIIESLYQNLRRGRYT